MKSIAVQIGERHLRITDLRRETVQVGARPIPTGRLLITDAKDGRTYALPLGLVPQAPCRWCARVKPINEFCEATPRCKSEHEKAERVVRSMQSKGANVLS